jgi:hypothetical protein
MTAFAGPGKYDDLATIVRERSQAKAVLVCVFGGNKGEGFSFQGDLVHLHSIPNILEDMARSIRKQQEESLRNQ